MELIDVTPEGAHASTLIARCMWYLATVEEIAIAVDAAIDKIICARKDLKVSE